MSAETDLYAQLSTYAGLTALVSTRIYPNKAPQNAASPYCAYRKAGNDRKYSHQGFSGLSQVAIEVSCYGETYAAAKAVAEQVTTAMEVWPAINPKAQSVFQTDEQDLTFEDQLKLHHIWLEFSVMYG